MTEEMVKTHPLLDKLPSLKLDERDGYEGFVVDAKDLVATATALRDEHGYDMLASLTGVDYPAEEKLEVVYHFYRSTGGAGIVLAVQADRKKASLPSLYNVYRSADFQEREAWDLLGIKFEGHPDLRRILMWEGFEGHPLRKDWQEAYFEEEVKPFGSRWPAGEVHRVEDRNPYGKNNKYPAGFNTPDKVDPEAEDLLYAGLMDFAKRDGLKTEPVVVNMGPQHPSTHGVFRMAVVLDGEEIVALKPVMGYLHRNHEKIGERNTWLHNMPFTDRLDYLTPMLNNHGYALAVEKLLGKKVEVPERAEYLRVIMGELTRISSHLWFVGFLLNDLGAFFTPALYVIEERELILDFFERVTGARLMNNYLRFGGVARDLPPGSEKMLHDLVYERLPRKIDDLDNFLSNNELVKERTTGLSIISPEDALNHGVTGPVLRASGVPYDVRRADPYGIYDRFDFDVAVRQHGDVYDRYLLRIDEMRQSLRILKQAVEGMPEGEILPKNPYNIRVPAGESYGRVESAKGELGFYVVSEGNQNPYRYHIKSPSFVNLTALEKMCVGAKVADVVVILGSIDIVLGEVDR
jgi:NADH/F420H2 dehydrogenase subunit C